VPGWVLLSSDCIYVRLIQHFRFVAIVVFAGITNTSTITVDALVSQKTVSSPLGVLTIHVHQRSSIPRLGGIDTPVSRGEGGKIRDEVGGGRVFDEMRM
jgi:hypothetical protein